MSFTDTFNEYKMDKYLNKITCGVNYEVLKNIPDNSIDLSIQSPPYSDLRDYTKEKTWAWADFEKISKELFRVTKPGGVCVWVVGDKTEKCSETLDSFKQAIHFKESCGFLLYDTMIYEKHNFSMPESSRYHQMFEYMFILSKGKPKTFNPIKDRKNKYAGQKTWGKNQKWGKEGLISWDCKEYSEYGMRGNIWKYITTGSFPNQKKYKHPAKFPENLVKDHVLSWSNENDIVLDCFGGSGTTAKVCKDLNRNFIHLDVAMEYCEIAKQRFKDNFNQEIEIVRI